MDYFISDLHLGHKRIIEFERFEFNTIEEHDRFVIDSIKSRVKEKDTLYLAGDVGSLDMLDEIKCRKIFIAGNHDKYSKAKYLEKFDEVYMFPIYYNRRVLVSHYPHPVEDHILNIHGHLHGATLNKPNHINVSAAMINYKPISSKEILGMIARLPNAKQKFLEEWYADLYVFDNNRRDNYDVIMDDNNLIKLEETIKHRERIFETKESEGD